MGGMLRGVRGCGGRAAAFRPMSRILSKPSGAPRRSTGANGAAARGLWIVATQSRHGDRAPQVHQQVSFPMCRPARPIALRLNLIQDYAMLADGRTDSNSNDRRYDVELLIVHPTIDPSEITSALGLEAVHFRRAGERRMTPKGNLLPGNYPDTRWRHSKRYAVSDQWFADKVELLLKRLEPHKGFLSQLSATGGRASIIIQFLGDGYYGDEIPSSTLARIVDLGLSFGIEVFVDPQS